MKVPSRAAFLGLVLSQSVLAQEGTFTIGSAEPKPRPLFLNSVEVGLGYQSDDEFFLGRYGGVTEDGPFLMLNGSLAGGDPWDGERGAYWDADLNVYGFDTVAVRGRYGLQGRWELSAFYEAFNRAFTQTARTPFRNAGPANLFLPADWQSNISSAGFATLEESLTPLDLQVKWRTAGGEFVFTPAEGYEVRFHVTDRDRNGVRGQSLPFGHEGNFPVGVFFPQPVDYETNHFTASISRIEKLWQWTGSYTFSVFRSDVDSVLVRNPFARSLGTPWPAGAFAGYPFAIGQYSLPPDTSSHRFRLSGYAHLSPKARAGLTATYTVNKQNDALLPYTATPQLSVIDPVPRQSLNAQVRKAHIKATLTARDIYGMDLAFHYVLDDRDNQTPVNLYSYVANDAQDQAQPIIPGNSRYIRFNLPHSFEFHQFQAEAAKRIGYRTRLSLTYTADFKSRSTQQVAHTELHTLKAKLRTSFDSGAAWVSVAYSDRNGSEYRDELPWDLTHTESYLNASPFNQSIEHPLLRKYNMADRERLVTNGSASFSLAPEISFTVAGKYARDNYYNSPLGLTKSEASSVTADISYYVADLISLSGFYTFERYAADQNGYLIFGLDESNIAQNWSVNIEDTIHSAGITADWTVCPGVTKFGGSYYLSTGQSTTTVLTRPFNILTESEPLPDAKEFTHNIDLHAEHAVSPQTAVKVGYTLQWHRSRDWQFNDIPVAAVPQILGSGIVPPRYTAHIAWITVRQQF